MDNIIKRKVLKDPLWEVSEKFYHKAREWKTTKTVCAVEGLADCGKTTYVFEYFKGKNIFYFSFAGLTEQFAEKLFAEYITEKTGSVVSGWRDGFGVISKQYKFIVFDDLSVVLSSERFCEAFYDCMITNINTRPFVVLIIEPPDVINKLADSNDVILLSYFSIPEVMKLYPKLSKYDILGLCAVSGGIPKIMSEYDVQRSLDENMRDFLKPTSAFVSFMPKLLSRYFRKPESYHYILYAIASGNHSVSEIGKFTGFAYNKCDNYLSELISCRIIKAEKVISKRGAEKTAYVLTNSYFRLWHLYVYQNRTEIQLGNQELIGGIIRNITEKEIHEFHLRKAFLFANERLRWDLWASFRIQQAAYSPQTVSDGDFRYTFDAIIRNGEKAVFIKVFADPLENCKRDELERIRKAVMLENVYYDSHVLIFSKRRFSDYAVAEAANDDVITLVEVDRLKFEI